MMEAAGTLAARSAPDQDSLRRLLRWQPPHGVLTVYLEVDPADRGEGWRIRLRNGLSEVVGQVQGHDARKAAEATAKRLMDRFPPESRHPSGRMQVGFVEVAERGGDERWFTIQMPGPTAVLYNRHPFLRPLLALLDDGAPRAVATVSAERIRLFMWSLGRLEELDGWGLETHGLDWRERKAQRPSDPARFRGPGAAGRDQFDQRLEANRERFLHEAGRQAAEAARRAGTGDLIVFGDAEHANQFSDAAAEHVTIVRRDSHNLVSAPAHELETRVAETLEELNRERKQALVERVLGEAHGGTHASAGPRETLEALVQGRVEHLVFDPDGDYEAEPLDLTGADGDPALPPLERMVELALSTSARVTPVDGEAAAALAGAGGVAALLRY